MAEKMDINQIKSCYCVCMTLTCKECIGDHGTR
ncbi:hypothetical protein FHEFKHOI_01331 [Candidatus Methanoperedenaceae archaeon GB50]|nr:hypothetical protein FHEFKHOI_01331 [Candidatus Methanoperedenaceae archaeon GB50]CAD7780931.1 MAG: hypothetical protein KBONHNOK_01554 [Candidatus Methanoperedenaceae archaeon GB50]